MHSVVLRSARTNIARALWAGVLGVGWAIAVHCALAAPALGDEVVVPAGTQLEVSLLQEVGTERFGSGSSFRAVLGGDLSVGGRVVATVGTPVTGRILSLQKPNRFFRRAKLEVDLRSIEIDPGEAMELKTSSLNFEARRDGSVVVETSLGAYAGATLGGALSDDQEKVRVFAAIGAVAGTILANKRNHIELPEGQPLGFVVLEAFTVTLPEEELEGGRDGVDGKDGVDGRDGEGGKDGVDGRDGEDGQDGEDGKVGTLTRVVLLVVSLSLHGFLTLFLIALLLLRSRRSVSWVSIQVTLKSSWLPLLLVSAVLVVLLALLVANQTQSPRLFSWEWFVGGILGLPASIFASLVANWMFAKWRSWRESPGETSPQPPVPPPPPTGSVVAQPPVPPPPPTGSVVAQPPVPPPPPTGSVLAQPPVPPPPPADAVTTQPPRAESKESPSGTLVPPPPPPVETGSEPARGDEVPSTPTGNEVSASTEPSSTGSVELRTPLWDFPDDPETPES